MLNYQAVIIMHFKYNLTQSLLHLCYKNQTISTNVNEQMIMDTNVLIGLNLLDWLKNLRIVLKRGKISLCHH